MADQPTPKAAQPIAPGDCFFFKEAFDTTDMTNPMRRRFVFPGFGFGMFMGGLMPMPPIAAALDPTPRFAEPTPTQLFIIMGNTGFITFDDIGRFIGKEKMMECIGKFQEKYLGMKYSPPNGVDHSEVKSSSGLILPIQRKIET